MLSMAQHLLDTGASFHLEYFSRSIEHTAFKNLLSTSRFDGKVTFHHALDRDAVCAYLRERLRCRPQGAQLYLCGPRPFMDSVKEAASQTWSPEAVHLEYFSADQTSNSGHQKAFRVRLARSGREYEIPADKSIVETLAAHGIHIETSCEQGVCGTCATGLLEGQPDHRDLFLTDTEKQACDRLMPCVSRSKSEILVLDI